MPLTLLLHQLSYRVINLIYIAMIIGFPYSILLFVFKMALPRISHYFASHCLFYKIDSSILYKHYYFAIVSLLTSLRTTILNLLFLTLWPDSDSKHDKTYRSMEFYSFHNSNVVNSERKCLSMGGIPFWYSNTPLPIIMYAECLSVFGKPIPQRYTMCFIVVIFSTSSYSSSKTHA